MSTLGAHFIFPDNLGLFVLPAILGFLGIVFSIIALFFFIRTKKIKDNGIRTAAKVIETVHRGDGEGAAYYPIVEFNVDGHLYKIEHMVGSVKPQYEDGAEISILYDSKNCKKIIIEDSNIEFMVYVLFGAIGGGALLIAIILFVVFLNML